MLSRLRGRDDHRRVQHRRRADVDDVDLPVGQQIAEIATGFWDLMLPGEIDHMVAARRNGRHGRVDPVHALVGIHVQLGDEAASDKANSHFRHRRVSSIERS